MGGGGGGDVSSMRYRDYPKPTSVRLIPLNILIEMHLSDKEEKTEEG